MPQRLGRQFSTLQPHPAGVGCLFRLHPVETVEAVDVRACRGCAVAPVAERVQNGSAGGVIDPAPSVLRTCVENKTSVSWLSVGYLSFSVRACSRLPQASVSLDQSAARAVLAGHTGLVFHMALRRAYRWVPRGAAARRGRRSEGLARRPSPATTTTAAVASHGTRGCTHTWGMGCE